MTIECLIFLCQLSGQEISTVIYLLNIGFGALFSALSVKLVTNTVLFLLCLTFWQQFVLVSQAASVKLSIEHYVQGAACLAT